MWLDNGSIRVIGDVFSITGQYMEYMFSDSEENNRTTKSRKDEGEDKLSGFSTKEIKGTLTNRKPITHWGSHISTIQSAGIYDSNGDHLYVIQWNKESTVRSVFKIPKDIAIDHLSASFSIKDLNGTDLIVSTTTHYQCEDQFVSSSGSVTVEFCFRNSLVTGRYLLVAAIEDRSSPTVRYYEYIEGATTFLPSQTLDTLEFSNQKFNNWFILRTGMTIVINSKLYWDDRFSGDEDAAVGH